jgi:4-aminobutyrate aminotransferase-like enzyme
METTTKSIHHDHEPVSNRERDHAALAEPKCLRTFTPTQAVLASGAGSHVWTPDGRRLADFTSGVLVANLGHNPSHWTRRFLQLMGWQNLPDSKCEMNLKPANQPAVEGWFQATPLTAYNALTPVEVAASRMLVQCCSTRPGGGRLQQVLWAASGSEAVVKALWAALGLSLIHI